MWPLSGQFTKRVREGSKAWSVWDGRPGHLSGWCQRSGKTTTTAKLGSQCKADGREVPVAACDTLGGCYRAIKGMVNGRADIVSGERGRMPQQWPLILAAAKSRNKEVLIIDTAGRLHTKNNLWTSLTKYVAYCRSMMRPLPPSLLVVDGSLGSNSMSRPECFTSLALMD